MFLNLLSNAFKYTERGSIEIKICVEGENVAISIHDTGKGIAMGDFNRIFDRFYQIEGSSESATSPGYWNWLGSYEEYCRETSWRNLLR